MIYQIYIGFIYVRATRAKKEKVLCSYQATYVTGELTQSHHSSPETSLIVESS